MDSTITPDGNKCDWHAQLFVTLPSLSLREGCDVVFHGLGNYDNKAVLKAHIEIYCNGL